jgi:arylsulfatase A-like enzyme
MSYPPNILIFMTDQQSGATIDPTSPFRAKTPNLDRFRAQAATFTNAFAPAPHCCPSRTSFFTSRYPSQHGVWNNVNVTNALSRGPRPGTPFWSQDFARAGYELAFTGKWHVSNWQNPSEFGWRDLLVFPQTPGLGLSVEQQRTAARSAELARSLSNTAISRDPRPDGEIIRPGWPRYVHYGVDESPFRDRDVVDAARSFLREQHRAPWLLYAGTLGPHDPYTPPQRFLDWYDIDEIRLPDSFYDDLSDVPALYRRTRRTFDQLTENEHREALRHYLAFCSYEDELFGELLSTLDDTGQDEDTVVVYLSDHGDYMGQHGLWAKGLPPYRAAYHIPLVIRAPGAHKDVRLDHPVSLTDLGPTLMEIAGLTADPGAAGHSLADRIHNDVTLSPRDMFFQTNGNEAYGIQRIVVHNSWKLVVNLFDDDELYDLDSDPNERTNLLYVENRPRELGVGAQQHIPESLRAVVADLYRRLWRFALEHDDEIINDYVLTALASFGPAGCATTISER